MDTRLKRVGHIALQIYEQQILLIWGGYTVRTYSIPIRISIILKLFDHHPPQQNENREVEYHDPQEVLLYDPLISAW